MRTSALAAALIASLLLPGCVRLRWSHENRFQPLAAEAHAHLCAGESNMGEVLACLGAPLFVWEQTVDSFAIAYGWYHGRSAGGTLSVPVSDSFSASFSYDDLAANLYGVVFTFDRDDRLIVVSEGYLRDIAPELLSKRPSFDPAWVEGAASSGSGS